MAECWIAYCAALCLFALGRAEAGGCGRSVLHASFERQNLTSPNYPSNYPSNSLCMWYIYTSHLYVDIHADILFLDIEKSVDCTNDSLTFFKGKKKGIDICGNNSEHRNLNLGNEGSVLFRSDNSTDGKGFVLQYYVNENNDDNFHPKGFTDQWGIAVIVVFAVVATVTVIAIAALCYCHRRRTREAPIQSFSADISENNSYSKSRI